MSGRAVFWRAGLALLLALDAAMAVSSSVVISQVYGGGGNIGAIYKNDFIELHNRGTTSVSIDGWTVQYADSNNWQLTVLGGTLQPGQYYLVEEFQPTNAIGSNLPSPQSSSKINLSTTIGKVALVSNFNLLSGTCPTGAQIVDFVGYGPAGCAEGNQASSTANSSALLRAASGCTDTDNNSADFQVATPTPRNSASTVVSCQASGPMFTLFSRSNNTFVMQFTADPARSNTVQFSSNLVSWSVLTAAITHTSNLFSCTDTNPAPRRFYRVLSQ